MPRQRGVEQLLEHLRDVIEDSDVPRREIDRRLGHSSGYLAQLLAGTLDLKYWQLIAILDVIDFPANEFFAGAFPLPKPSLSRPADPAMAAALAIDRSIVGVYGFGVDSVRELRLRLERVERTLYGDESGGP
ncbi:MAG: hypothetical protein AAF560_10040 [Acidobacteriota bacterium]